MKILGDDLEDFLVSSPASSGDTRGIVQLLLLLQVFELMCVNGEIRRSGVRAIPGGSCRRENSRRVGFILLLKKRKKRGRAIVKKVSIFFSSLNPYPEDKLILYLVQGLVLFGQEGLQVIQLRVYCRKPLSQRLECVQRKKDRENGLLNLWDLRRLSLF